MVVLAADARQLNALIGDVINYFDNSVVPWQINILFCMT